MIYLDHQASTPVFPAVLEAMIPHFSSAFGNPHSSDHAVGWAAADAVEQARERVGAAIGAMRHEVVFTSGATEANNLALLGAAAADRRNGAIVVSAIEHRSILAVARALEGGGRTVRVVPVDRDGFIDMRLLAEALAGDVCIVSVGLVNSEIGVLQDMTTVAALCRRRGVLLHTDATQALAWNALDVEALGVDLASVSAHKIGGPQGVGALFVCSASAERVAPVLHGGGQEGGLRPGTLPTALCVGFGAACGLLPDEAAIEEWRATTDILRVGMCEEFGGAALNGASRPRHPGNLNLHLPGVDAELLIARAQPRVALARGSACSSGTPEPSHVLRALGLTATEAESSVRLSVGRSTTIEEVRAAVVALRAARP